MTLVFDNTHNLQGQPGVHALIIGVSAYPHLPGGTGQAGDTTFGLSQISSAAATASRFCEWLVQYQHQLPAPLATCQVLLSPAPHETTITPADNATIDRATRAHVSKALYDWRTYAQTHPDNVTFFYFAGHGIQSSVSSGLLLLEDFAAPQQHSHTNTVALHNIVAGMHCSHSRPIMAQTQCYFIDACRTFPNELQKFSPSDAPPIFDIELSSHIQDTRCIPIFFATAVNGEAHAQKWDTSFFGMAVLQCLQGGAAIPVYEDAQGHVQWKITISSLLEGINTHLDMLTSDNLKEQVCLLGGQTSRETFLLHLDNAPSVEVTFELLPNDAHSLAHVSVRDHQLNVIMDLPAPVTPHPYQCTLPAGMYHVTAEITPPNPIYKSYSHMTQVFPPKKPWKMSLEP